MNTTLSNRIRSLTLKTKLMILGISSVLITAIFMVGVGFWQGQIFKKQALFEVEQLIDADLTHIAEHVYHLIKAQDEAVQLKVNHDLKVARYVLEQEGGIRVSDTRFRWTVVNQYTQEQHIVELPVMSVGDEALERGHLARPEGADRMSALQSQQQRAGGNAVELSLGARASCPHNGGGQDVRAPKSTALMAGVGNISAIDQIYALVGGTATIFQRMNEAGDLLRIATNVQKADGTRAVGTYIPAIMPEGTPNPVVSAIMQGNPYRGTAYVVNAWYVTAYEPLVADDGRIIGALYVGVRQEHIHSLRQAILQINIGKTGYVFIVGGKGEDRGHYIISKDGKRDGEDLWNITDAQGRLFVRSIVKKAISLKPGEFEIERYPWQNPGESRPRQKIVRLAYYNPWDWVIGTSAYIDELQPLLLPLTEGYQNMLRMFVTGAIGIAILGGVITLAVAESITHPLRALTNASKKLTQEDLPRLVRTMQAVNQGDLSVTFQFETTPVHIPWQDELGTLARAFSSMNTALVTVGDAFTHMVANLRQLTGHLEQRVAERTIELQQEILERKQIEEALRESEQKLSDIINFLPDATFVIDRNGYIIAWNKAIERLTGVKAEEMLGKDNYAYAIPFYDERRPIIIDLVNTPSPDYEKRYEKVTRYKNVLSGETFAPHLPNGGTYLFATAAALYDSKGHIAGAIESIRDISERKRTEKALRHAKESADAANRAKSEFLANMSHELRTPLNAILGYAQILKQERTVTEKQKRGIEVILHSGNHLLNLINDILDLSKIEVGKFELELAEFHLPNMLKRLVEMTRIQARQKGLAFLYEHDPMLPRVVYGDEKHLYQVLLNLLGNGMKFTERGRVVLRVRVKARWHKVSSSAHGLDTIRFEVEDTGCGIPSEQIETIFSPFERIKEQRMYTEGTGLGLAISRRLVRMMKSDIQIKSTVGQGSQFWFHLVLPEIESAELDAPSPYTPRIIGYKTPDSDIPGRSCQQRTVKILVADDTYENRTVLKDMLLPLDFEILEAVNGQEAITKAFEYRPDLILMDVVMPVVGGLEAIRHIRQFPALNEIPIIGVSASAFDSTRQEGFAAGCNDFIVKPIQTETLLERLQIHLGVEWMYEGAETAELTRPELAEIPLAIPPQEQLETLLTFARMRNITEIRKRIAGIKEQDERFSQFLRHLEEYARTYQFKPLIEFITRYLPGEDDNHAKG